MQSVLVGELMSKISLAKKFNIIPRSTSELEFNCTQFFQAISIEHWPTSNRLARQRIETKIPEEYLQYFIFTNTAKIYKKTLNGAILCDTVVDLMVLKLNL